MGVGSNDYGYNTVESLNAAKIFLIKFATLAIIFPL